MPSIKSTPSTSAPGAPRVGSAAVSAASSSALPPGGPALIPHYQRRALEDRAHRFQRAARADNTRRAYEGALKQFRAFCAASEYTEPHTPLHVCAWLAYLAQQGKTPTTIRARLAALRRWCTLHYGAASPASDPAVARTYEGICRTITHTPDRSAPLTIDMIHRISMALALEATHDTTARQPRHLRNRALILIGFAAACRRSELARMRLENCTFSPNGVVIDLIHHKTQQRLTGAPIAIARGSNPKTCPVAALEDWITHYLQMTPTALSPTGAPHPGSAAVPAASSAASPLGSAAVPAASSSSPQPPTGPLFPALPLPKAAPARALTGATINHIVRAAANLAGLSAQGITAHSLRTGFATAMADAGAPDRLIQRRGRWKSPAMVAIYDRAHDPFTINFTQLVNL